MNIYFSNQGSLRTFVNFAKTVDFGNSSELHVSMHEKWMTVHPAHLVLAAALAMRVGKENSYIDGVVPKSALYLDRMGLYRFFKTPSPFAGYEHLEPAGRFVPITVIKTADDQTNFITEMIPLLHLSENDTSTLKYVVGELLRNVLEHAFARDGAMVAAQYYKNTNRISLAICDTGIGLWKSLQIWRPRTDVDALQLALLPGVSGTTRAEGGTSENAGAGLFFIRSIVKTVRGYFTIYSGNAAYTMLKQRTDLKKTQLLADPFSEHHALTSDAQRFDGTLVAVDLPLDETANFRVLMDEIGDVLESAIRERKRKTYRRPNFM